MEERFRRSSSRTGTAEQVSPIRLRCILIFLISKLNQNWLKAIALSSMALAVFTLTFLMSIPSEAQSAKEKTLINAGKELFETAGGVGCKACHGPYAEGDIGIGPYNRGVGATKIRAAVNTIEQMSFLKDELNDVQIDQIGAYYQWLGELQLFKTLAKRGRFIPNRIKVYPGTRIQLVINNSSPLPHAFAGENMKSKPLKIDGREFGDMVWTAPNKEGVFTINCSDCRRKLGSLTIEVTKSAKRHISPTRQLEVASKLPEISASTEPSEPQESRNVKSGRALFLNAGGVGCVACHGLYAEGDVGIGPYNRGFSETRILRALAKVDAMKFLGEALNATQTKQVAAYYDWLGKHQLIKTVTVKGLFFPAKIRVHPGAAIQLVVRNQGAQSHQYSSSDMDIGTLDIAGRQAADVAWTAPSQEGVFKLVCSDCAGTKGGLTIEVTRKADKFVPKGK